MNLRNCSITILAWVTGLVVLFESYRTLRWALRDLHGAAAQGIHPAIRLGLAAPELVAAILFLVPGTRKLGGYALLVLFGLAISVHLLHGEWNFEVLLVYTAAVWVCITRK